MRCLLLLILLVASAAFAQGTLEVIPLRHRTVDQVLPVLRPLLEPGGAMSGQFNQLIVRTSPDNLAQIRAALDAIDQPVRRLTVSVRFDSAQASIGATRAGVAESRVDQQMQVLEGGQAFISAGESRIFGEAATGFAIVPRVSGANVFLEVMAQQENFARGGAVQGQRAAGTVSGRLGEWIELGGTDASTAWSERSRRVWVKVEEIGN